MAGTVPSVTTCKLRRYAGMRWSRATDAELLSATGSEPEAALGSHGELVREPSASRPTRAQLGAGVSALVRVLADPTAAFPRRATLA